MARFLCQLCYTTVHYGEKHPCFCYGNDENFCAILQLQESETTDFKADEIIDESHTGHMKHGYEQISSNIRGNNAEWPSELYSNTTKKNQQISILPSTKGKSKYPYFLAGTSNNSHLKNFRGSSLPDLSAEIWECEVKSTGNNASLRTVFDSGQAFESSTTTAFTCRKKELQDFELPIDFRPSTRVNSDSSRSKGNVEVDFQKSHDFMKDAAMMAEPSGIRPLLTERTGKRVHACDLCPKQFMGNTDLVRHYRTHTGEKPFECDICGKGFTVKCNLVSHYRTHTDAKPFECDICGKGFTVKCNLVSHYRTHTDARPFACDA